VKFDPVLSDRVLEAVREQLPDGVSIERRALGKVRIKSKPARFEWAFSTFPAFSHLHRRDSPADKVAGAMEWTLQAVTKHLHGYGRQWPGLAPGAVTVNVVISGDTVIGKITDSRGACVQIPPVRAT
jgi:hypothetical protein